MTIYECHTTRPVPRLCSVQRTDSRIPVLEFSLASRHYEQLRYNSICVHVSDGDNTSRTGACTITSVWYSFVRSKTISVVPKERTSHLPPRATVSFFPKRFTTSSSDFMWKRMCIYIMPTSIPPYAVGVLSDLWAFQGDV